MMWLKSHLITSSLWRVQHGESGSKVNMHARVINYDQIEVGKIKK